MPLEIRLIPCLADNYAVLLRDAATDTTVVVDAPEVAPILAALDQEGWNLTHILVTHHHTDHIAGVQALKERFGATVIGPKAERDTIPGLDFAVVDGDPVAIGGLVGRVLETPGHTKGHIVFLFEDERLLFSGDTLFVMGCGRPFECDPPVLWNRCCACGPCPTTSPSIAAMNTPSPMPASPPASIRTMPNCWSACATSKPSAPSASRRCRPPSAWRRRPIPSCGPTMPNSPSVSALRGAEPGAVFTELRSLKNSFRG